MIYRLLVHASEKDQDGRYYRKSLGEVDEVSLVRDRTGRGAAGDLASELAVNVDAESPDGMDDVQSEEEERPMKPSRQLDLENEWGLHRSRPASQEESERDGKEESETDSERRGGDQYQVRPSISVWSGAIYII